MTFAALISCFILAETAANTRWARLIAAN